MGAFRVFRPAIKRTSYIAHIRLESGELVVLEYQSRIARFLDLGDKLCWNRARLSSRTLVEPSNK